MNDNSQLRLFEGADVEVCRLTVTGSTDSTDSGNPDLPTGWKLGERVRFLAEGTVTKVTHARTGNGLERQHVVVIDELSFDERPPGPEIAPPPASPVIPFAGEGGPASDDEVNDESPLSVPRDLRRRQDALRGAVRKRPPWPSYESQSLQRALRVIEGLTKPDSLTGVIDWEQTHQGRPEIFDAVRARFEELRDA